MPIASFAAPAASAACWSTAPPTRFTRSIGDCDFDAAFRDDFFADERFAEDFLAVDFDAPADLAVGRLLALFFADPRAVGRRDVDFLRAPLFFAPRFAAPFLAPLFFFAAPFLAPERLPLLRFAPPRDDLARVAIVVYPREGGDGRNSNFRAQADVGPR